MKSTEVYRVLRDELAPVLKSLGFKRGKEFLSWTREHDGLYTVLWCQVSRDGWDEYAGSSFVVEFQRSEAAGVGMPAKSRKRISKLLADDQRAVVLSIQNKVISDLHRAPGTHVALQVSPDVTKWYLRKFELQSVPYKSDDDVWFRYARPEHVAAWAEFLAGVLPGCLRAIEDAA